MDFIAESPSSFHAVASASRMLEGAGFRALDEKAAWKLERGGAYYVVRNSGALLAFVLPDCEPDGIPGISVIAAHTDSPCFKIKENPEISTGERFTSLNVEAYGGMIMSAWLDRVLSVAGRAFVRSVDQDGRVSVSERLVNIDRDLCLIPNLCVHMNRDVNRGYEYKVQKDMLPLIAQGFEKGSLNSLVAASLDVDEKDIVSTELFLYNRDSGKIWGLDNEFFSSPRIDDLMCAFCAVKAITEAGPSASNRIRIAALFDNEEVGSSTRQGAMSDFMYSTAGRIAEALKWSYEKQCAVRAGGMMISADNGHSFHPNRFETNDPVNRPVMNGGVLIKFAGNQKYTTDAQSAAFLKVLLEDNGIPYQVYHNNSNYPGGSTLGNLSQRMFSLPCADIGAAQLAMHSPYETAGTRDTLHLTRFMTAFMEV